MKHLFPYKEFLIEGLSKEQEDRFLEDWDQDRLEDWFGKKNHRLYFKLLKKVGKEDVEEFLGDVESQVEEYLEKTYHGQYILDDYRKGHALDTKNKNRQVRLGKVIKDPKLLQAFNDDPARAGHRMETRDPIICLSKHPLDIAAMSTGRGWVSCKELPNERRPEGGPNFDKLYHEVKVLLIAYLIYPNDRNIEHPIARINLLPYYNAKGQTYYHLMHKHYGELGDLQANFYATLGAWLDEKQKDLKSVKGKFTLDYKVYPDGADDFIRLDSDPVADYLESIINGEYEIVDGKINVTGDVDFTNNIREFESISKIGQFGKVTGDFTCCEMGLTSLEGCPEEVGGSFNCADNHLRSLKHAPKKVGWDFVCANNRITSLAGCPEKIFGDFGCSRNHLPSLEGGPKIVDGNFRCLNNNLTSLEGGPKIVRGNYNCSQNTLVSIKGAPREVAKFSCQDNYITSLEGGPERVGGSFECYLNHLTSLKGAPRIVKGNFRCSINRINSIEGYLEGYPEEIGGDFTGDHEIDVEQRKLLT